MDKFFISERDCCCYRLQQPLSDESNRRPIRALQRWGESTGIWILDSLNADDFSHRLSAYLQESGEEVHEGPKNPQASSSKFQVGSIPSWPSSENAPPPSSSCLRCAMLHRRSRQAGHFPRAHRCLSGSARTLQRAVAYPRPGEFYIPNPFGL